MEQSTPSRRRFLAASANLASVGWITMNWPQIAAAADLAKHTHHDTTESGHTTITTLTPAEAADVEAIADQIVPSGATPGAKEARVLYFIDNALGSFFATQLPSFRQGLAEFQKGYAARSGTDQPFAAASGAQQTAWLHEVDQTPFFVAVRRLTVLGLLALPKYGGNQDQIGWKLIGVIDNHVWEPPFGWYDDGYQGFVPYPGTQPYTA